MTIQEANQHALIRMYDLYENREAENITDLFMEYITGWRKLDRRLHPTVHLSSAQFDKWEKGLQELEENRPLQYVIGQAWFSGLPFYVDERVLIPRPETDELVEWIVSDLKKEAINNTSPCILDIGSGSGCIPISLKKKIPTADVWGCDVSEDALTVASINDKNLNAGIHWIQADFLDASSWDSLPKPHILVSNPPYIPFSESCTLNANVLQYEPHSALFVEDRDDLIFYRKIVEFSATRLREYGKVYLEVHEDKAGKVAELFNDPIWKKVEIKKDMQGKERMVCISR